jgi:hypothetical protein
MTRRYDHASTVLPSNKDFEEWGEIFGDDVIAAALIDPRPHCISWPSCATATTCGGSDLWQTLHTAHERSPAMAAAAAGFRLVRRPQRPEARPSSICQIFNRR